MKKNKTVGHAAHTKDATVNALAGDFSRPIKITMLGAGSGFTPRLVSDVLQTPGTVGGVIALVDIDESRLGTMAKLIRKLIVQLGKTNWKVQASTDRSAVLAGSHYIVNCIEVSGMACVKFDNDIPLKYGIDQCIGDTIGPGGLFKALRTVPVFLAVLRDVERLCPEAIVLNYTNPMSMMCLAAGRSSAVKVVGLCHSVQGTSDLLSKYAGVPYAQMEWACAGINHLAWFTTLKHEGRDLYPNLKKKFAAEVALGHAEFRDGLVFSEARNPNEGEVRTKTEDLIRKDMCLQFGAFITESSGHLSEYLPYYRKSSAGRELLRTRYDGGSRFYANNWPDWRAAADTERVDLLKGKKPMEWSRSWEYASWIIEAREKNVPFRFHGNVLNRISAGSESGHLITNLPSDGCVEVACLVDRNGVQPTRYGALPAQMAALCASNMWSFDLGATAAMERSKEAAIHALLLDPLSAAVCSPKQIRDMTLELFKAEKEFLPGYK